VDRLEGFDPVQNWSKARQKRKRKENPDSSSSALHKG